MHPTAIWAVQAANIHLVALLVIFMFVPLLVRRIFSSNLREPISPFTRASQPGVHDPVSMSFGKSIGILAGFIVLE